MKFLTELSVIVLLLLPFPVLNVNKTMTSDTMYDSSINCYEPCIEQYQEQILNHIQEIKAIQQEISCEIDKLYKMNKNS